MLSAQMLSALAYAQAGFLNNGSFSREKLPLFGESAGSELIGHNWHISDSALRMPKLESTMLGLRKQMLHFATLQLVEKSQGQDQARALSSCFLMLLS